MRQLGYLIVLTAILIPGAASAQTIEFPESYYGIWEFSGTDRECVTGTFIENWTDEADTLCPGDGITGDEEFGTFECNGSIDETSFDVTCSGSFNPIPECTGTILITTVGTRSGNTITGTETFSMTWVGDCGLLEDECTESEFTGTLVSPGIDPSCETVPTLPASWGTLKTLYED